MIGLEQHDPARAIKEAQTSKQKEYQKPASYREQRGCCDCLHSIGPKRVDDPDWWYCGKGPNPKNRSLRWHTGREVSRSGICDEWMEIKI